MTRVCFSVLFTQQRSIRRPTRLFSFLNPLATRIWFYMAGAYVLVSITIWIVAGFSPREWREPQPCDDCLLLEKHPSVLSSSGIGSDQAGDDLLSPPPSPPSDNDNVIDGVIESVNDACRSHEHPAGRTLEILENGFTVGNSFWFAIGSLMQQGSDLNPKVDGGWGGMMSARWRGAAAGERVW